MIPNIFHFVFGMSSNFGGRPFSLSHYLAIKSAIEVNKPDKVYFHYQFEPEGTWWDKIKPEITLIKIDAPKEIFGNKLHNVAHQADIVRLKALYEHGGVYLDADVICKKPLKEFYNNSFVIGQEFRVENAYLNQWQYALKVIKKISTGKGYLSKIQGLCNAVMMAEPKSKFIELWLESYKNFRSVGRDQYWSEHSVEVPLALAKQNPDLVKILSPKHFHFPLWDPKGISLLFEEQEDFEEAYLHHIWESFAWERYLSNLTPSEILTKDTTYNKLARNFL
ncbi:hypothetical protein FVR03_02315 [Pontibacter qinzhouensis]|uniref:Glycosyl transferase n=1 Tax=Pontibacter qinzhouensis TaxID=2603253 RepID=A0A5C8KFE9_9BACT|nr:glycosyltransferase [Pontibacter qinzhouensis]TXK52118.1 hypothetical protein FVR03_02315 [Pontibacter qinzhouensis]